VRNREASAIGGDHQLVAAPPARQAHFRVPSVIDQPDTLAGLPVASGSRHRALALEITAFEHRAVWHQQAGALAPSLIDTRQVAAIDSKAPADLSGAAGQPARRAKANLIEASSAGIRLLATPEPPAPSAFTAQQVTGRPRSATTRPEAPAGPGPRSPQICTEQGIFTPLTSHTPEGRPPSSGCLRGDAQQRSVRCLASSCLAPASAASARLIQAGACINPVHFPVKWPWPKRE